MPQSLGKIYTHLVFSTENQAPALADLVLRQDLHGYMTGIVKNLGCLSLRIGGGADHVHALVRMSRVQTILNVVDQLKLGSWSWLCRQRHLEDFAWQDGYGAFSVSYRNVDPVIGYIRNQATHHGQKTFADEYTEMLRRADGHEHNAILHTVFSTKHRIPFLTDKTVRSLLHEHLAEICATMGCAPLRVGGVEDHVHILFRLCQELPVARVVQDLKKISSRWLATEHVLEGFDWQEGYGAFSVSPQHEDAVGHYIDHQEEHHRQEAFMPEYRRILQDHNITDYGPEIWE